MGTAATLLPRRVESRNRLAARRTAPFRRRPTCSIDLSTEAARSSGRSRHRRRARAGVGHVDGLARQATVLQHRRKRGVDAGGKDFGSKPAGHAIGWPCRPPYRGETIPSLSRAAASTAQPSRRAEWHVGRNDQDGVAFRLVEASLDRREHAARRIRIGHPADALVRHRRQMDELGARRRDQHDRVDATVDQRSQRVSNSGSPLNIAASFIPPNRSPRPAAGTTATEGIQELLPRKNQH